MTGSITRLVLWLFLENTQRRWTAGGMTKRLSFSSDSIRQVHTRLVAAHWARQTWESSPGAGRRLVWLSPAGVDRARGVLLREELTDGERVLAAAADLSVAVLHAGPSPASGGAGGDPSCE